MKAHPAALLLPQMTDDEYAGLKADIAANGQRHPVVVHLGLVLDGRHRLRACEDLGIDPKFEDFTGGDPIAFVLSANVHRRSLTASQRAAVAVEAEALFAEQATKRMKAGKKTNPAADLPQGQALDHAAKATGASRRSAQNAKAVKAADPETFEAIKRGEVTVDRAAKQVQAKNMADADAAMERIVRQDPEVAADLDRLRLKASFSKHFVGVNGLLTLDADAVHDVLDDIDRRLVLSTARALVAWAERASGGGLRIVKEQM